MRTTAPAPAEYASATRRARPVLRIIKGMSKKTNYSADFRPVSRTGNGTEAENPALARAEHLPDGGLPLLEGRRQEAFVLAARLGQVGLSAAAAPERFPDAGGDPGGRQSRSEIRGDRRDDRGLALARCPDDDHPA